MSFHGDDIVWACRYTVVALAYQCAAFNAKDTFAHSRASSGCGAGGTVGVAICELECEDGYTASSSRPGVCA